MDVFVASVLNAEGKPRFFLRSSVGIASVGGPRRRCAESEERSGNGRGLSRDHFQTDLGGKIVYSNEHGLQAYGVTQADLDRGWTSVFGGSRGPAGGAAADAERLAGAAGQFLDTTLNA